MKRILQFHTLALGLLILLFAFTGVAQAATLSSGSWQYVPSVNPPGDDTFFGVAAIAKNDVWAVGSANQQSFTPVTLAEHWNGSSWSVVPTPNPSPGFNKLFAAAAISSNNVWAVGYSDNTPVQTLVEHYNGSSWSLIPSPSPGSFDNRLNAVTAISANDIWAVGEMSTNSTSSKILIEHYNGTKWSVVPSPSPSTSSYNHLNGVAAISATNVVAVGNYTNAQGVPQTLVERYDGTKWSVISSPNPNGSTGSDLFGVTAISATDILAVGDYGTSTPPSKTLIEQYNGTKWSILPSPNSSLGTSYNIFSGVAAASATNIYAVGEAGASNGGGIGALSLNGTSNATSSPTGVTLIEHWNGTKWSVVSSPNPGTGNNSLYAVAHIPSTGQFWAVGAYNNGVPPVQTLAEFYNP